MLILLTVQQHLYEKYNYVLHILSNCPVYWYNRMGITKIRLTPMIDGRFYQSYQLHVINMKVLVILMIAFFVAAVIKISESI